MTNTLTYQYCHVCDYYTPPYKCTRRILWFIMSRAAASTDTSSFNITDTQTYLSCHVAIIIDTIDNITDILALPGLQYLLMPMSLLPMRRYIYTTMSVVLLTPVTISLTCRHMLTYIAIESSIIGRRADIGHTHVGDIIDSCDNIGSNIAIHLHCSVSSNY